MAYLEDGKLVIVHREHGRPEHRLTLTLDKLLELAHSFTQQVDSR